MKTGALYKVEFHVISDTSDNPHTKANKVNTPDEINKAEDSQAIKEKTQKKSANLSMAGKAVGVAITAGLTVYNHSMNEQSNSLSLQGDSIAARNLSNQRAITNEVAGVVGGLTAAAIIGGPVGLAAAAGYMGIKYAMQAVSHQQDMRLYDGKLAIEQHISAQNRSRIQLNSREFR